tara:strand:+ start:14480 stop:14821 length:342 start_codon:yes stop_codon:yes gene_type:complete
MIYEAKQTTIKKRFLFGSKQEVKKYTFDNYNDCLIFCLDEQIPFFNCLIGEGMTTKRKTFKNYYSLEEFKKVALKNPLFFLGVHDASKANINTYYFYLVKSHLNKLLKLNTIK